VKNPVKFKSGEFSKEFLKSLSEPLLKGFSRFDSGFFILKFLKRDFFAEKPFTNF